MKDDDKLELGIDPFNLIIVALEALGWSSALPEGNEEDDIDLIMIGNLDKIKEAVKNKSKWEIFVNPNTPEDGELQ